MKLQKLPLLEADDAACSCAVLLGVKVPVSASSCPSLPSQGATTPEHSHTLVVHVGLSLEGGPDCPTRLA